MTRWAATLLALAAGMGACGGNTEGTDLLPGYHASGRGDAPAGRTVLVLQTEYQSFQCNGGSGTFIAVFANGAAAGSYSHFTGSLDQIPPGQFQAVLEDVTDGVASNKRDSQSGTLTLDGDPTGSSLTLSADLQFNGGSAVHGSWRTSACDLEL